jgi:quercetin dioxygenase-like cupin family protein
MLRARPGAELGTHDHFGRVIAYTVSGSWRYAEHNWVASAGDVVYETANSQHTLVAEPGETVEMFIYVEGNLHFVDGDGNIVGIENAKTFVERYVQFCRDNGYPDPDLLGD